MNGLEQFGEAVQHIDRVLERRLIEGMGPGLSMALTTDRRLIDVRTYGVRNESSRAPVTQDTLFQIGSITKHFTAAACMRLMEEGRLDVEAPVTQYLPWFKVGSQYETRITIHHLLTHTSGMIMMIDSVPSAWGQTWRLRDTRLGFEPGERFSYSNVGYNVLQCILETITGQGFDTLLRELIFEPLGMRTTYGEIRHGLYDRMAQGHKFSPHDDRPSPRPEKQFVVNWYELSEGCGSVVTTPSDLAVFLRMLLQEGIDDAEQRFLRQETFARMTHAYIPTDGLFAGTQQGYGILTEESKATGGRRRILGGGENLGCEATMYGDFEGGLGVIIFCNSYDVPWREARWMLDVLLAASEGDDLPKWPHEAPDSSSIGEAASDYVGVFRSETAAFSIRAEEGRAILSSASESCVLQRIWDDAFLTTHPRFAHAMLTFGRDSEGRVVEAFQLGTWYRNSRHDGPTSFDVPEEWATYVGQYRAFGYFVNAIRIFIRKGRLTLQSYGGYADSPLVPLGDRQFGVGRETSAERVRFDWFAGGKALRCRTSNGDFYRVTG